MKPERKKNPIAAPRPSAASTVEELEPSFGSAPIPIWIFVSLGALLYFAFVYLDQTAGGFNSLVYEPYESFDLVKKAQPKTGNADIAKGREIYGRSCVLCHQPNGLGTPGSFPPLVGSEWATSVGPDRMIRIVLNGLTGPIKIKGADWNATMPPWRDTFTDDEIAAVISFVRQEWGNAAPPVKSAHVKSIRDATTGNSGPWTAEELLKIPEGGESK